MRGKVELQHVYFAYNNFEEEGPVLEDVSFTVQPGQKVALVGPSGSGKSTIISLIPRFYDVQSGRVWIDDQDVRDLKLRDLRRHIGMVLQTPVLFSGTIKENILYGQAQGER